MRFKAMLRYSRGVGYLSLLVEMVDKSEYGGRTISGKRLKWQGIVEKEGGCRVM